MNEEPTKVCKACGAEKSLCEFAKSKTGKLGYRAVCRLCNSIYYRELHPKRSRNIPPTKCCTVCKREFPRTPEFWYRTKTTIDGLGSRCKECAKERTRQWGKDNPERVRANRQTPEYRARKSARRHTPEYREKQRAEQNTPEYKQYKRAYRQNPEVKERERRLSKKPERKAAKQVYANRPERIEYRQQYYKNHPEVTKVASERRLARKRGLPDAFTRSDWRRATNYFHGCCAVCGRPPGPGLTLAADHWIPLADTGRCPGTVPTNIVPLCHSKKGERGGCNQSKRDRPAEEWLASKLGQEAALEKCAEIETFFLWIIEQDTHDSSDPTKN